MPSRSTRLNLFQRSPDAPPTPAQMEANIAHLVWDIGWFGIAWGTVISFLQVYVVRLGASSLLVGAITYGPALVGVLWQFPVARMLTRSGHRMRWVVGGGFFYRLMFLLVALAPFAVLNGRAEVTAVLWVLQAIPSTVSNTAFFSMLADAVPADRMTQVVGWRSAAFGLANTLSSFFGGRLLAVLPFPLNYQVLFLIGFAASMISWWHINQIHLPDRAADRHEHSRMLSEMGQTLRYPRFGRFLVGVAMLQLALGMIAPLLPLYWVRQLGADDGQISIVLAIFAGAMVLGSLTVRRFVDKIGRERVLAIGALGYVLYPLLTSFAPSIWGLVPWAALAGVLNAAITVTLFDNLMSVTPDADRTNYIAVYNVVVNLALFAGPIIAGLLALDGAQSAPALRISAGVTLVAGVLLAARRRAAQV